MQIIQTIRDKGAAIIIGVIALSLIGFLLMDARQGSSGFFNSLNNSLGKVNGAAIERADFDKRYNYAYNQAQEQSRQTGQAPNGEQIREQVWNQMINETIFYAEAAKLGIEFTSKELNALLYSNEQGNPFLQQNQGMLDPATGRLDPAKVATAIANIKKAKGEQYEFINNSILMPQELNSVVGKYASLLGASAYYPGWMKDKDNAEAKNFANITYAYIPYGEISDSTVKVSDAEINEYVSKHKKQFKQEAGRMISYVTFSQVPSAADSAATREQVASLKSAFEVENNVATFVAKSGSAIPYDSNFIPKSRAVSIYADSIGKLPAGSVYGPFIENGSYVIAKMLGVKMLGDSAKARHILIPTIDPQTQQPVSSDSAAKKLADSLLAVINKGGDFAALAKQYSSDPGSKDKGGFYDYFPYGQMMPEFNDFCFSKPAGTKAVVKTAYGYHVMEAMGTKGSSPAYKIAFIAKEIFASEATFNTANQAASQLASQKTVKNFDAYVAKNGLTKISWPSVVKENDYAIGQLQDARSLVRWAFEAKKGDVSEAFNINKQFVVAAVEGVAEEGTQSAGAARPMAEGVIRNKKKADIIIKKLGSNPTPETAAAAYNKQAQTAGADSSLVFINPIIPNVGMEAKVIGASFNKEYQTKASPAIAGGTGVFVVKVNSIGTKPADSPEQTAQTTSARTTALKTQAAAGWFDGLKNQATVKDNRSKFY